MRTSQKISARPRLSALLITAREVVVHAYKAIVRRDFVGVCYVLEWLLDSIGVLRIDEGMDLRWSGLGSYILEV